MKNFTKIRCKLLSCTSHILSWYYSSRLPIIHLLYSVSILTTEDSAPLRSRAIRRLVFKSLLRRGLGNRGTESKETSLYVWILSTGWRNLFLVGASLIYSHTALMVSKLTQHFRACSQGSDLTRETKTVYSLSTFLDIFGDHIDTKRLKN